MLMYNRFGPWQVMRTMCGVLIWTRSILCLVPGTLGQCKVCLLFKVGHFKRKSSSVFEFGTDVRERFCFFTPIHMEGKTFVGSIKSTRSHTNLLLVKSTQYLSFLTEIVTPWATDWAKNQHLVGWGLQYVWVWCWCWSDWQMNLTNARKWLQMFARLILAGNEQKI